MRFLTFLAVAAVAAGVYHYRQRLERSRQDEQARSDGQLAERVETDEPVGDLGPMQSGIATGI
jgi:hypothetical protein